MSFFYVPDTGSRHAYCLVTCRMHTSAWFRRRCICANVGLLYPPPPICAIQFYTFSIQYSQGGECCATPCGCHEGWELRHLDIFPQPWTWVSVRRIRRNCFLQGGGSAISICLHTEPDPDADPVQRVKIRSERKNCQPKFTMENIRFCVRF